MNRSLKAVWNVTKWEYSRFYKWQDMIKGSLIMLGFGVIGAIIGTWVASDTFVAPEIAVYDYGSYNKEAFQSENLQFSDRTADSMDALLKELEDGELNGILTIATPDSASIRMQNERPWLITLREYLDERRTELKLQELDSEKLIL